MESKLNANSQIYESIRKIAHHKLVNPHSGSFDGTGKIQGRIVNIHTDPSDELCGTVDVQEYINPFDIPEDKSAEVPGLHLGVYLSAIQNNESGIFIIPFLHSEVIIETDPATLREYVTQYSHADKIQVDSHNEVIIGVTETEEFKLDSDSPDYDKLEKTGKRSNTKYSPTSILNVVAKGEGEDEQSKVEITADSVLSKHDKAEILLDAQQILAKYNAKEIVIKEDGVYIGKGDATEPAVLGDQLAAIMDEWLGIISKMVTATAMGPQPPTNLAQFIALQSKIKSYRSSVSGFLSKTVKVAE